MKRQSAGLLMFRRRSSRIEFFLVHPGGPFFKNKDLGAWSIPKGEYVDGEEALSAAKREFEEETGCKPEGNFVALGSFAQPGGKLITAWAIEGDFDLAKFSSNSFLMEWPPRSGRMKEFPEADRAGWFGPADALRKILKGQTVIVNALLEKLAAPSGSHQADRHRE
jgi:predicted NUDIX family NTP pyrophosphohydrolase